MSPYYVFFGREPPVPTFTGIVENRIKDKSYRDYIREMKDGVKVIHDEARKRTLRQKGRGKKAICQESQA